MKPKRHQQSGRIRNNATVKPSKYRPSAKPKFEQKARDPLIRLRELAAELRVIAAELDYGDAELDYGDSSSSSLSPGSTSSGEPASTSSGGTASTSSGEPASTSSCDPTVALLSVAFSGGHDICYDDSGSAYPTPQYVSSGASSSSAASEVQSPYLYVAGSTMSAKPVIGVSCLPTRAKIRGWGSDGITFPATNAIIDSSSYEIYPSSSINASSALPSGITKFYNPWDRPPYPFTINWEVSFDGGTTWESAGTSENPMFVSLAAPLSTVTLFYTTAYLALYNDGATSAGQAKSNTWDMFVGPASVDTWYGNALYYYQPTTTFATNPTNAGGLLSAFTGNCRAWASLLQDAWGVNGISSELLVKYAPSGYNVFWVKQWGINSMPGWFNFGSSIYDMIPAPSPSPNNFGALTNSIGIPGQHDTTPSEKVFSNHQFLEYSSTYYDPSYGVTYAYLPTFYNGLLGWGYDPGPPSSGNYVLLFETTP